MLRTHEHDPDAEPVSASGFRRAVPTALAARAVLFVSAAVAMLDLHSPSLRPGELSLYRSVTVKRHRVVETQLHGPRVSHGASAGSSDGPASIVAISLT